MDVCDGCGRSRKQGAAFCTGCGRRFTDDGSYPSGPHGPPLSTIPRGQHPAGQRRPRLTLWPVVITLVITFAVGSAVALTLLRLGHHAPRTEAARPSGESTRLTPSPSQDGSTPAASPSASSLGPSSVGQVTIAAGASQDANASSVAAFLDHYFTAINNHDYQSYISLLSPQAQQGLTAAQFDRGYRSTADSAETLVSISTVSNGDLAAAVTFTSHQNPADSPDQQQSCTDWNISLFLVESGGGYLVDQPPPGYHASYHACT
jgi:hypothetical protein